MILSIAPHFLLPVRYIYMFSYLFGFTVSYTEITKDKAALHHFYLLFFREIFLIACLLNLELEGVLF